jgi:hypothetical protein
MKLHLAVMFLYLLLLPGCVQAQIPGVAESHIEGNVPEPKDFRQFLIRSLTAYLKPKIGQGAIVDYELLRDVPTQVGVADPKFYVWVTARKNSKTILDGAARIAAIEKKEFDVTHFVTRQEIVADPSALARIFPATLLPKIRAKAGINP